MIFFPKVCWRILKCKFEGKKIFYLDLASNLDLRYESELLTDRAKKTGSDPYFLPRAIKLTSQRGEEAVQGVLGCSIGREEWVAHFTWQAGNSARLVIDLLATFRLA